MMSGWSRVPLFSAKACQRGIAPEEEMDMKPRPMRPETSEVRRLFNICVTTPKRQA